MLYYIIIIIVNMIIRAGIYAMRRMTLSHFIVRYFNSVRERRAMQRP